jgi:hypothetical protein
MNPIPLMAKTSNKTSLAFLTGTLWAVPALLVVLLIESSGFVILGRYAKMVVPYGAALAGMFAGVGYYLMSRRYGVQPSSKFVAGVVVAGLVPYGLGLGAQYLLATISEGFQGGFVAWVQQTVEHSLLTQGYGDQNPVVLGRKGYLYILLEMVGFAVGLAVPPLCQSESAFCPDCKLYMKKESTRFLHGQCSVEDVKRQPKSSWQTVSQQVFQNLRVYAEKVHAALKNDQASEALAWLHTLPVVLDCKQVAAWEFELAGCRGCAGRHVTIRHHLLDLSSKIDNVNHRGKLEERIFIPASAHQTKTMPHA